MVKDIVCIEVIEMVNVRKSVVAEEIATIPHLQNFFIELRGCFTTEVTCTNGPLYHHVLILAWISYVGVIRLMKLRSGRGAVSCFNPDYR
jgi:hypothetical protein